MRKKAITILAIGLMIAAAAVPVTVCGAEAFAPEMSVMDMPTVKVRNGGVVIDVPGDTTLHVVIYALTGQVIKQFDVAQGNYVVDLPAGYYIVRVGHTTVKVAVK